MEFIDPAAQFFTAFLDGATAGQALLGARRVLLVRKDPLGLAYGLYGFSAPILDKASISKHATVLITAQESR